MKPPPSTTLVPVEPPELALARPLVLGEWPAQVLGPVAVLVGYALAAFWLAAVLTRRRFAQ